MWEEIEKQGEGKWGCVTERMRVFGGWVLRSVYVPLSQADRAIAQTFIPDPGHLWRLDKK